MTKIHTHVTEHMIYAHWIFALWLLRAIEPFILSIRSIHSRFFRSLSQWTGLFFCHRIWYIRMKHRFYTVNFFNWIFEKKKLKLNFLWIGKLSYRAMCNEWLHSVMCPHHGEGSGENYVREAQLMRQPKYLKRNLWALINCISSVNRCGPF